ncbi:MAG: hypothetical protein ACOYEV_13205 [Candidatus Nanopelagicales bacterium]
MAFPSRPVLAMALTAALLTVGLPALGAKPVQPTGLNRSLLTVPAAVPASYALGNDISWPNCPKGMGVAGRRTQGMPLPDATAEYVIIGLTNGRAFTRNPCLTSHLQMAASRGLATSAYTMLSYPNATERRRYAKSGPYSARSISGQVSNVGYAQAKYALNTMTAAGFAAPLVWIDVEPRAERAWSRNKWYNRALISGAIRAARDRGIASGIYTYATAWKAIVGAWRVDAPLWAPSHTRAGTQEAKKADAISSCERASFTGGPLVITQWVHGNRDYNVICPRIAGTSYPYFLRFVNASASPTPEASVSPTASPTTQPSDPTTVPPPAGSPSASASESAQATPSLSESATPSVG